MSEETDPLIEPNASVSGNSDATTGSLTHGIVQPPQLRTLAKRYLLESLCTGAQLLTMFKRRKDGVRVEGTDETSFIESDTTSIREKRD